MPDSSPRLVAENLACRRGERLLFSRLSLTLEKGNGLMLIGPNGVGKTSLLRLLAGLLAPESGSIRLDSQQDVPLAEQTCFIGVRDGLKAGLTPAEHIDFWLRTGDGTDGAGRARAAAMRAILAEFAVADLADLPCGALSTGQRRRVALSRLFCQARPLWLLDEPLNGLDGWSAARLAEVCGRHLAAGGMLVAASHQPLGWPNLATLAMNVPLTEQNAAP